MLKPDEQITQEVARWLFSACIIYPLVLVLASVPLVHFMLADLQNAEHRALLLVVGPAGESFLVTLIIGIQLLVYYAPNMLNSRFRHHSRAAKWLSAHSLMVMQALLTGALGSYGAYLRAGCYFDIEVARARAQLEALNAAPVDITAPKNYFEFWEPPCQHSSGSLDAILLLLLYSTSILLLAKLVYFAWFLFVTRASRT